MIVETLKPKEEGTFEQASRPMPQQILPNSQQDTPETPVQGLAHLASAVTNLELQFRDLDVFLFDITTNRRYSLESASGMDCISKFLEPIFNHIINNLREGAFSDEWTGIFLKLPLYAMIGENYFRLAKVSQNFTTPECPAKFMFSYVKGRSVMYREVFVKWDQESKQWLTTEDESVIFWSEIKPPKNPWFFPNKSGPQKVIVKNDEVALIEFPSDSSLDPEIQEMTVYTAGEAFEIRPGDIVQFLDLLPSNDKFVNLDKASSHLLPRERQISEPVINLFNYLEYPIVAIDAPTYKIVEMFDEFPDLLLADIDASVFAPFEEDPGSSAADWAKIHFHIVRQRVFIENLDKYKDRLPDLLENKFGVIVPYKDGIEKLLPDYTILYSPESKIACSLSRYRKRVAADNQIVDQGGSMAAHDSRCFSSNHKDMFFLRSFL